MSNNWFQFKQFIVRQENSAMKVGTDGVLLGAWATVPSPGSRVLDIGTGNGLIALIIAQRTQQVIIDAVEIDPMASDQAFQNFQSSPWNRRLNVFHDSFQNFYKDCKIYYDLLICNPPFFSNSLKASSSGRNLAKHDDSLDLTTLFMGAASLMKGTSVLSLVLPMDKTSEAMNFAGSFNLMCVRKTWVITSPGKQPKRVLLEFSFSHKPCFEDTLMIETGKRHQYSDEYKKLTGELYLDK